MLEAIIVELTQQASVVETRPAPSHITSTPSWARPVTPACIIQEAQRQQFDVLRVLAVLKAEGGRVGQYSRNTNGSYDVGPMQLNTVHIPEFAKLYGVSEPTMAQLLAYDGCFNVAVGAMVLRKRTNEANGDFWYGIGRYHSKTPAVSTKYILRVYSAMKNIVEKENQISNRARAQALVAKGD